MRYFQKLLCLLILVLAASFGVGGCVLLYSDFSVQRSRMAAANAAAHAQACTLLQTEILDLQRRGISTGDAALTARVTAQGVPAALFRNHDLVCATLPWLQNFPLGDTVTVTVPAEVEGLLSGMFADVTFHTAVSESAVVVPSEAILTSSDRQYVFIVENDTAKRVDITTGLTGSGMTEVTSGLDAGEQLVTVGQQYLSDGDAVRVVEG